MTDSASRRAAHEVIRSVRTRDAFAPKVLASRLDRGDLDERDAALTTRLTYGTLQMLGSVDHAIDHWASSPEKIPADVRDVLRVAAWELIFGEGAAHAAVNEAVEAVKAVSPRAVGFTNAILRKIAGDPRGFPWDDSLSDVQRIALQSGHPEWLVARWTRDLGADVAAELVAADNTAAGLYLLMNPFMPDPDDGVVKTETEDWDSEACPLPGCVRVASAARTVRGAALSSGRAVVQDAASQLTAIVADPQPGDVIIEVGSGAGTKSMGLQAVALRNGGVSDIFAVDIFPAKVSAASERLDDLGVPGVVGYVGDGTDLASVDGLPERADIVVIDAPCSGLGTLRRHPMKRWRVTPSDVSRLADLQLRLLLSAAEATAPSGAIVYATCTVSRTENEDVVRAFLASSVGSGFSVAPIDHLVPQEWGGWISDEGWFQSLQSTDGPDGHFVVRLERR